jgi:putative transposase
VLEGKIAERLKKLFQECAEINSWNIEELNIQRDHVHMILRLKPSVSVSRAVQLLKGGSSKIIREEYPSLEEFLWGDSFWSDGYFAETVGKVNEQVIREYVKKSVSGILCKRHCKLNEIL